MAQGITFSGLGSGLDTDSIISQLVDIERRPITLIQSRQAQLERQKGIVQQINTELLALKDSAERLADDNLFSIVKVTSQDSSRVSVSASNEAASGSFNVEVLSLAQGRSLSSRSFSSTTDDLQLSGEFVLNGESVEVETNDSLLDLRDAINGANQGVNAQVLSVSSGDNRLILSADDVGAKGFDIKDASSTDILEGLGFTSSDATIKTSFCQWGAQLQVPRRRHGHRHSSQSQFPGRRNNHRWRSPGRRRPG